MAQLAQLASLDGPFHRLRKPGGWLWAVILAGAALRIYLVCFTEGTLDVVVWDGHAREVLKKGLVGYYHGGQYQFNHPPLMGILFSFARELSVSTGIPFAIFLRAPFAILDVGTTLLLFVAMGSHVHRYTIAAAYWLHPLALIFSSYHGNTDSAIGFFVLAAVVLVSRGNAIAAGAVLGLALWVKVPGVLALPALALALPSWSARLRFGAAWAGVGILSYLPVLYQDARIVIDSVFLYPGLQIQTQTGVKVWGIQNFYPPIESLPFGWRQGYRSLVRFYYLHNTLMGIVPLLIVAWCRRREHGTLEIARNVACSYVIIYGLTNFWAFQYLAWSLPLWLLMGWRFALPASLVATAYVYGLYAWLCDSLVLQGYWDFIGKANWPTGILMLRDGATLFFFVAAWVIIVRAVSREWRVVRTPSQAGP